MVQPIRRQSGFGRQPFPTQFPRREEERFFPGRRDEFFRPWNPWNPWWNPWSPWNPWWNPWGPW